MKSEEPYSFSGEDVAAPKKEMGRAVSLAILGQERA